MEPTQASGEKVSGVSTHIVEAVVAICILILGIVVASSAHALGSSWTSEGPGSGYFPFWIGMILCVSGIGSLYQALKRKNRNTDVFVDNVQLRRVLSVFVPAIIYVGAVQLLGLYVASFVYITAFMVVLGKYSVKKSLFVSLCVMTLFFLMFELWFKVPLFKGQFNLLGFLGY